MPKIQDMVKAEAEAAEAENPDEPVEGESEEEQAAEDEEASEPADAEATEGEGDQPEANAATPGNLSSEDVEDIEKENKRHQSALLRVIRRSQAAVYVCETCDGAGVTFTHPDPLADYETDPDTIMCGKCNGYGKIRTASKNPDVALQTCLACSGRGIVSKPVPIPEVQTYTPTGVSYQNVPPAPPGYYFNVSSGQYEPIGGNSYAVPSLSTT